MENSISVLHREHFPKNPRPKPNLRTKNTLVPTSALYTPRPLTRQMLGEKVNPNYLILAHNFRL
jgi:hypothetical protein